MWQVDLSVVRKIIKKIHVLLWNLLSSHSIGKDFAD